MSRTRPLPILLLLLSLPAPIAGAADWRAAADRDGVRVYTREVAGSRVAEVRADGIVAAPPQQVMAVLRDVEAFPTIMPSMREARLLRRSGPSAWFYMVIDPPLIAHRDYCLHTIVSRLPGGVLSSEWRVANDVGNCPPPPRGMVRIIRTSGRWLLTPAPDGKSTQVVYQAHADPGGAVPAWMVNLANVRVVPGIFRSLRRAAALPRYAGRAACPAGDCQVVASPVGDPS